MACVPCAIGIRNSPSTSYVKEFSQVLLLLQAVNRRLQAKGSEYGINFLSLWRFLSGVLLVALPLIQPQAMNDRLLDDQQTSF